MTDRCHLIRVTSRTQSVASPYKISPGCGITTPNAVDTTSSGGYQRALRCVDAENAYLTPNGGPAVCRAPFCSFADARVGWPRPRTGAHTRLGPRYSIDGRGLTGVGRAAGQIKRRHQVRRRGVSACASKSTPDASQNRSTRRLPDFTDRFARRLANPADHRARERSDPTVRSTRRCPFPADQPVRRPADPNGPVRPKTCRSGGPSHPRVLRSCGPSHPKVFWAGNRSARRPSDPRAPLGSKTGRCAIRHSEQIAARATEILRRALFFCGQNVEKAVENPKRHHIPVAWPQTRETGFWPLRNELPGCTGKPAPLTARIRQFGLSRAAHSTTD